MRSALVLLALATLVASCATSEEAAQRDAGQARENVALRPDGLAFADPTVGTVQLYRTGDETSIPIVAMGRDQTLTLGFDLMGNDPRPLTVYFYHANRTWRRDLVPAEYLTSFHRDDVFDYQSSRATHVQYVHYNYEFPNGSMDFRISGNYIVRVSEQGMEEDVLLERAFYVSEQSTPLDFALDNVRNTGDPFPALQPTVQFTPPSGRGGTPFDYTVCFLRNGRNASERCTDRPAMDVQPALRYFLEPRESFFAESSDFWADVSSLRIGARVERADLLSVPYTLTLEPDYFRFPGTAIAPIQNGQIVVENAVTNVSDPASGAEYMNVRFALVPDDERPVPGSVALVGPFNEWTASSASTMEWVSDARRYETTVLLKQGMYEYRYAYSDPEVARAALGASPRFDNAITAFVYYNDIRVGTDRLISAVTLSSR
ncbi:MAG: hypothetical protein ACI80V_001675 [Rhodothermales bacterium]|jgi:hypothetical protein